jgi:hypothetical protein
MRDPACPRHTGCIEEGGRQQTTNSWARPEQEVDRARTNRGPEKKTKNWQTGQQVNGGAGASEGRCDVAADVDFVLEGIGDAIDGRRQSRARRGCNSPAGSESAQPGTPRIRSDTRNRISKIADVTAGCDRRRRLQEQIQCRWCCTHGGRERLARRMTSTQFGRDRAT